MAFTGSGAWIRTLNLSIVNPGTISIIYWPFDRKLWAYGMTSTNHFARTSSRWFLMSQTVKFAHDMVAFAHHTTQASFYNGRIIELLRRKILRLITAHVVSCCVYNITK